MKKTIITFIAVFLFVSVYSFAAPKKGWWNKDGEVPIQIKNKPEPQALDFAVLLRQAQQGNVEAQTTVGKVYRDIYSSSEYRITFSDGKKRVPVDYFAAYDWLIKAAEKGNAEAMYQIGNMYSNGEIGPMELNYFYSKPSKLFVFAPVVRLASDINCNKALEWYLKAANLNYADAYNPIADYYSWEYINGRKVKPNIGESVKWRQMAINNVRLQADNGNGNAMAQMMDFYLSGTVGIKKDLNEAKKWYNKTIEFGDANAIYSLGLTFYNLIDQDEGIRLIRAAAEHNIAGAQLFLGEFYGKLTFVTKTKQFIAKDKTESTKWYRLAAENGDTQILIRIKDVFIWGTSVEKDLSVLDKMYRRMFENGNAMECYRAGDIVSLVSAYKNYVDEQTRASWEELSRKLYYRAATEGISMLTPTNHISLNINEWGYSSAGATISTRRDIEGTTPYDYTFWYINSRQQVKEFSIKVEPNEDEQKYDNKLYLAGIRVLMMGEEKKLLEDWNAKWRRINPK
jgi:TPR repeat protein